MAQSQGIMQIHNLPPETNNRYALDDYIKKHNPLVDILRQATKRPSTLPPTSINSHSHLCAIALDKGLFSPCADFSPPPNNSSSAEYIFSFVYYSILEKAHTKYEQWKKTQGSIPKTIDHTLQTMPGRVDFILNEFFTTIKYLHAIFRLIESHRVGIQQG